MVEGAALHVDRLRERAGDFDPDVRDRLIAGRDAAGRLGGQGAEIPPLVPRPRRSSCSATSTSCSRRRRPAARRASARRPSCSTARKCWCRPNIGVFTQPISFIGLPVAAVPVWTTGVALPIGVQVIAAPWREDLVLRVARALEREGVVSAPIGAAV